MSSTRKASSKRVLKSKADPSWVRARRDLLERVKDEVTRRLGTEPSDVREFTTRYESSLRKPWKVSTKQDLVHAIERADIVFGGDFHAYGQAQRTHLKILRSLPVSRPVVLALECFPITAQKFLDSYVRGDIDLHELRLKSDWDGVWGFPWENFKPLFELARLRGFKLVALNAKPRSGPELRFREKRAAGIITGVKRKNPDALIYVVFGDLHVANMHLPAEVDRLLPGLKRVVVHLNSDRIYFQLATKGLEQTVDVVRLPKDEFCVISSPPWVKWQSYLLFLDRTVDHDLEDADAEEHDSTDQVVALVQLIGSDLHLSRGSVKGDDLAVYTQDDERIWKSLKKFLTREELSIAQFLLSSGKSFFVPGAGAAYLSRETINHAAGLAGAYVHAKQSGLTRPPWKLPKDFQSLVWVEAVSYFLSKLINHKRQSETLYDLRAQLDALGAQEPAREAMRLALDQTLSELLWLRRGRRRPILKPRRKSSYIEAARIVGGMMGERLYLAFRSRKLNEKGVVALLKINPMKKDFATEYESILERIDRWVGEIESTIRKERL
ncbi:MAG TPA: ChaN family lipoprotein [Bdellovibrionales bacterium]|nr:ChaN family lipoprotein [Bdellovibrionales bacterium]